MSYMQRPTLRILEGFVYYVSFVEMADLEQNVRHNFLADLEKHAEQGSYLQE